MNPGIDLALYIYHKKDISSKKILKKSTFFDPDKYHDLRKVEGRGLMKVEDRGLRKDEGRDLRKVVI